MDIKAESLPILALLIVISFMTYTNLIIINDVGRTQSIIPLVFILILWSFAILKIRRNENVH